MEMSPSVRVLLEEHRAFYEVSPHYVVVDQPHESTERVQDGFDVFIYGVKTEHDEPFTPPPQIYAQGYEWLRRIAEQVKEDTSHSCVVDVLPLPAHVVLNPRDDAKITAVLVIRIARWGVNGAAGPHETRALAAVEKALHAGGVKRR
jgi:hypothetical protein